MLALGRGRSGWRRNIMRCRLDRVLSLFDALLDALFARRRGCGELALLHWRQGAFRSRRTDDRVVVIPGRPRIFLRDDPNRRNRCRAFICRRIKIPTGRKIFWRRDMNRGNGSHRRDCGRRLVVAKARARGGMIISSGIEIMVWRRVILKRSVNRCHRGDRRHRGRRLIVAKSRARGRALVSR